MRKPRVVRRGARVAIVAPASPFARAEFEAGVEEVRRLGFEPAFDERVFARHGYLAGPAALRAAVLRDALRAPEVAAIFCVRGGYGSVQVLPLIDPQEVARARKAIVGYSDVTSLLTFVTGRCGLVGFHGPMLAGRLARGEQGYDRQSLLAALGVAAPLGDVGPGTMDVLRPGLASGPLFGGTLTQLVTSLGTPFAFDPPGGCLLLLEDVNERPYRLDRMITQLRLAGILDRAAGIVVGDLPGCDEPHGGTSARETLADVFEGYRGPVAINMPSGHTRRPAVTLPLGVAATLDTRGAARLIVEESAVED